MNNANNSKLRYLTMFSSLFLFGLLATPVTGQEKPTTLARKTDTRLSLNSIPKHWF